MTEIEDKSETIITNNIIDDRDITEDESNNVSKVWFVLKLIVIITIGIFLLCESIQLINLYYGYYTGLSIHYEYMDVNLLPSITVCLPAIVHKQKLIKRYTDLENKLNGVNDEESRKSIVNEYLERSFETKVWTELSLKENETFNCTLNYWPLNYQNSSNTTNNRSVVINCRDVVRPVERFSNNRGKCFTYFSGSENKNEFIKYSMKNGVRDLNAINEIMKIEFKLDFEQYLSLGSIQNMTTIAIHHQNVIPNTATQSLLIEAEHQYDITINKITSKLLPKPYKTMCHYYSPSNGLMSREDCIDNCVVKLYKDKCKCRPYYLTNVEQLLNTSNQVVCSQAELSRMSNPCFEQIAKKIGLCLELDRCPHDCDSVKYNFRTLSYRLSEEMSEKNRSVNENKVVIRVGFDHSMGDTIVRHVPVMTCGQLFCYISSIIAIFSGLTVIGITNTCINSFTNRILSIKSVSKSKVSDEHIINGNNHQNQRWRIPKSKSNPRSDCISGCLGSPHKQRKTEISVYHNTRVGK